MTSNETEDTETLEQDRKTILVDKEKLYDLIHSLYVLADDSNQLFQSILDVEVPSESVNKFLSQIQAFHNYYRVLRECNLDTDHIDGDEIKLTRAAFPVQMLVDALTVKDEVSAESERA